MRFYYTKSHYFYKECLIQNENKITGLMILTSVMGALYQLFFIHHFVLVCL